MLSKAARRRTRSSEAARSTAAQAEVEREHTALAVQQQHSTAATTRWVRAGARQCGARRAAQGGETSSCISGTQAVLAAVSRHHLERMRRELRASREAGNGEEDEEADEVGVREWAEASHRGSSTRSARWRRRRRRAARRPPSSQRWLRCAMAWRGATYIGLQPLAPRVVASGVLQPLAPGVAACLAPHSRRGAAASPRVGRAGRGAHTAQQARRRQCGGRAARLWPACARGGACGRGRLRAMRCLCYSGGVRELQSRWRALLLGLPAAAAYAAVAQQTNNTALTRHLLLPVRDLPTA